MRGTLQYRARRGEGTLDYKEGTLNYGTGTTYIKIRSRVSSHGGHHHYSKEDNDGDGDGEGGGDDKEDIDKR